MSDTPRQYAFQHSGLDRAEYLREDGDQLQRRWPQARLLIIGAEGQAHFSGDEEAPEFVLGAHLHAQAPDSASFLGLDEAANAWFALPAEHAASLPAAIFAQARALLHWQQRNRYCGVCAEPLQLIRGGFVARCQAIGSFELAETSMAQAVQRLVS